MSERDTMVLRGRLGTEPVTYNSEGKQTYLRFRMVVPRSRKRDNGEWEELAPRWYTIRMWGTLATNAAISLHKGQPIVVVGRPVAQAWQDKDGNLHSELAINASSAGHDLSMGVSVFRKFAHSEVEAGAVEVPMADSSGGVGLHDIAGGLAVDDDLVAAAVREAAV